VLECVVNISEGRDPEALARLEKASAGALLDLHTDADHHRSVFTLIGEQPARTLTEAALAHLDLGGHEGAHPRLGVVDVVPFVALGDTNPREAVAARDRFAAWLSSTHGVPCFLYGPDRPLPEVRRRAFHDLDPDHGPAAPHPRFGATAVGARPVLVAYNLWLADNDLALARRLARALRGSAVRALGLDVGGRAQLSMNLVDPTVVGPAEVYDRVADTTRIQRAELVGLLPDAVRSRIDPNRWEELGLHGDCTIEARVSGLRRDRP
jgi:glutamate formiminotransferase / 5-formyltetrahydrofolate cyclo-ligase